MAVSPANSAVQAPRSEPIQTPKREPKRPQNTTAATQTPGETRSAVSNAFGKVPGNAARNTVTKTQGNNVRPPVKLKQETTGDPASAPANTATPVDPKVQAILDTRLPDGKTVKEKLDGDAPAYIIKAAQDHYNKQKEAGEQPDAVSRFYLNNAARDMAKNGVKEERVSPEKLAEVFNTEQIDKNLDEIAKDPVFLKWASEQQANSVQNTIDKNPDIARLVAPYLQEGENHVNALRRMQSDTMSSEEFADAVADGGKDLVTDSMKTLASLGLGEKEMRGVGNTLAENIRSKYTPDAPKPVIDPNTNKPIQTEDGNNLAILPDGTNIALGADGKAIADKQGNPYVYYQDGSAQQDANGKFIQYDARAKAIYVDYVGIKYMLGLDRKGRYDAQGRPLGIDSGAPVALNKDGKAVTDAAGNKLVFDPLSGKAVVDPASGNAVVIDPATKGIVQADASGKVISGKNGDPYAADQKTGEFVQDAQGRYAQISKDNIAPGILPGYVVDANDTRLVVSPVTGRPMVDPALGKTIILDPKTNAPQLVPLDANGAPKLTTDGKSIIYDESGNTVVSNEGKGPNWLVDANGSYVRHPNGNYIGVNSELGLAAPVDDSGFIQNGNGLVPLWDIKANAPMTSKDGGQVAADEDGNLLLTNIDGTTVVEEKTSLPYLFDPKTKEAAVNPDTGRSILLDKCGLPVEYNADDGYKYLINPETGTTVKTAGGNAVTTDDNGVPYAVRQDGSVVKNPDTGNTIVYGTDGMPAKEQSTGYHIEITSSGNAHVIDPKTSTPMAERDPDTGGYQVYNKDGSDAVNPDTGNKVQMVADSGLRVEIDPKTNKPVTDAGGNPLILGPNYKPVKTPDGKAVVADLKTGLPVSADANGKLIADPASKLPLAVNAETGAPLADPETKAAVVADPKSRQPVQLDAGGKIITDPVTAMPVAVNKKTGAQVKGPGGALAVNDPRTGLPVVYDSQSKLFTVVDRDTGKVLTDPKTGAKTIVDPGSGIPFNVLPDAQGNHIIVDENGQPVKDAEGNQPWFDSKTGTVVMRNAKGEVVDPKTGKAPEKFDPENLVYTTPLLMMGPPGIAVIVYGHPEDEILPDPLPKAEDGTSGGPGQPSASEATPATAAQPAPPDYPWEAPGYRMSPEERAAFIDQWKEDYKAYPEVYENYVKYFNELREQNPALRNVPDSDLVAIRAYTIDDWGIMANKALYTRDAALLKQYELYIKAVQSGLTHLSEAGFRYQGPSVRYMNLTPDQFSQMFSGSTYTNRQFMSTSTLQEGVFNNMNTRIEINNLTGVDIQSISVFSKQKEVIGQPPKKYWLSNIKVKGSRGGFSSGFKRWPKNEVTMTEIPAGHDPAIGLKPDAVPQSASKAATNWGKMGKVLGKAGMAAEAIFGGVQIVTGGMQINDGVKSNDPYDIAAGSLNVAAGVFSTGSAIAGIIGGAAAAATAPFAAAGIIVGGIAGIVDFAGSLDDDEQFADKLEQDFGPLGILQEGWRQKAQEAYKDGSEKYMGPDYTA